MAGTSTAILSIGSNGFSTPAEVYEAMDDDDDMTSEEAIRILAEMERYLQRQEQVQQSSTSSVASDLDETHRQTLPAGAEFHRMDTGGTDDLPPLRDIPPEVRLQQPSSSTSGTLNDIVVSGAKAGVET